MRGPILGQFLVLWMWSVAPPEQRHAIPSPKLFIDTCLLLHHLLLKLVHMPKKWKRLLVTLPMDRIPNRLFEANIFSKKEKVKEGNFFSYQEGLETGQGGISLLEKDLKVNVSFLILMWLIWTTSGLSSYLLWYCSISFSSSGASSVVVFHPNFGWTSEDCIVPTLFDYQTDEWQVCKGMAALTISVAAATRAFEKALNADLFKSVTLGEKKNIDV